MNVAMLNNIEDILKDVRDRKKNEAYYHKAYSITNISNPQLFFNEIKTNLPKDLVIKIHVNCDKHFYRCCDDYSPDYGKTTYTGILQYDIEVISKRIGLINYFNPEEVKKAKEKKYEYESNPTPQKDADNIFFIGLFTFIFVGTGLLLTFIDSICKNISKLFY